MIISQKKKFIFIHTPKCAGISMRRALNPYHDSEITYWHHEYARKIDRIVDKAHLTADIHNIFENIDLSEFTVFTIVRNPYDRFISAYKQFQKTNEKYRTLDINQFCQSEIDQWNIRYDWNLVHFTPQYLFSYHGTKCIVDFFARFEQLDIDIQTIQQMIDIEFNLDVHNKSPFDTESLYQLNDSSIALINSLYEKDFLLFHYKMITTETDIESTRSDYEELIETNNSNSVFFKLKAKQKEVLTLQAQAQERERQWEIEREREKERSIKRENQKEEEINTLRTRTELKIAKQKELIDSIYTSWTWKTGKFIADFIRLVTLRKRN